MEHIIEIVLEFLFGLTKDKPDEMPEIEYRENFTVKHPVKKTVRRILSTLLIIAVFSVLWIFIHHDMVFAVILFLGVILLVFSLIAFSFRCAVNEDRLRRSYFGMFKKEVKWEDVICVKVIEKSNEKSVTIALYGRDGKCVIDLGSAMQNVWYIVKMAECKGIEIRKEKTLR